MENELTKPNRFHLSLRNRTKNPPIVPTAICAFELKKKKKKGERQSSRMATVIQGALRPRRTSRRALAALNEAVLEAVAICLLWSTANPLHELRPVATVFCYYMVAEMPSCCLST